MKLLRNPLAVGVLGALAFGVAIWNVIAPMVGRYRLSRATPPPTQTASAAAPVVPSAPTMTGGALPEVIRPIDRELVLGRVSEWLEAPRRDPFELFVPQSVPAGPRASELLSLRAIWRQAGGQFAVINNTVLGEGEQIAGFKLERIEADSVWVRGTNGSERVEFSSVTAAANSSRQPQ
jgi:hypothetical protein